MCIFTPQLQPDNEALEANFVRLVQGLLDDPKEREHFVKVWHCS